MRILSSCAILALVAVALAFLVIERPRAAGELVQVLPRDAIPSIDRPAFTRGSIADDARVLGIDLNGDARAYPVAILSAHEIVNDVVGGQAIAVTW